MLRVKLKCNLWLHRHKIRLNEHSASHRVNQLIHNKLVTTHYKKVEEVCLSANQPQMKSSKDLLTLMIKGYQHIISETITIKLQLKNYPLTAIMSNFTTILQKERS